MSEAVRIVYQLCQKSVFDTRLRTQADLKAWVADRDYSIAASFSGNSQNRADEFSLSIRTSERYYASLANDCNRFALAAIESIRSIGEVQGLPQSVGWTVVKAYYAAFYAAHALLRMYGRACTQYDSSHVQKVYELANVTMMDGGVQSIEQGFYRSETVGSAVHFRKLKDSHADSWASFGLLLKWLTDNLPSQTTGLALHKSRALSLLSDLKQVLSHSGSSRSNWLSTVRNTVHYGHSHGVWYPYRAALHRPAFVNRNAEWLALPESYQLNVLDDDVSLMVKASNGILSLMYHLLKYGYERAGKTSVPFSNGVFRLLNQIQVA